MNADGRQHQAELHRRRTAPSAAMLLGYFPESGAWLVENIYDGRRHQAGIFRQRIGHNAGRLLNCFPETRSWLVENIYDGHPDLLVLLR